MLSRVLDMCMYTYNVFTSLSLFLWQQIKEFCVYAHAAKPTQDTPRIEECIQLFNGLTIWVVCSILKEHSAFRRADIVEKFIDTTKVCCMAGKIGGN